MNFVPRRGGGGGDSHLSHRSCMVLRDMRESWYLLRVSRMSEIHRLTRPLVLAGRVRAPFTAPQFKWPQMMMCFTCDQRHRMSAGGPTTRRPSIEVPRQLLVRLPMGNREGCPGTCGIAELSDCSRSAWTTAGLDHDCTVYIGSKQQPTKARAFLA
jgi:hypothetical protein